MALSLTQHNNYAQFLFDFKQTLIAYLLDVQVLKLQPSWAVLHQNGIQCISNASISRFFSLADVHSKTLHLPIPIMNLAQAVIGYL